MLGDSIIKNIKGFKMKEAIDHQENVHVYTFPGANVDDMNSHVNPTIKEILKRSDCTAAPMIYEEIILHKLSPKTLQN